MSGPGRDRLGEEVRGIVGSEREGLWAYYYVLPEALAEFSAWLS